MAAAVGDDGAAGDEIRSTLRPVVDSPTRRRTGETGAMIPFFRGQIDD
jgi:hypothetical protein